MVICGVLGLASNPVSFALALTFVLGGYLIIVMLIDRKPQGRVGLSLRR
jgi:hypothetical protein